LALAALLLSGTAVWAQETTPARPKVRTLLQSARECYGRGDYETAAFFYEQVKANEKDLSPAEANDFRNQILLNNEALRRRREGSDQIHKAEDALRQGRTGEASALLKSAGLNQYITANDRRLMAQLSQQLRSGSPIPPGNKQGNEGSRPPFREDAAPRARVLLQEGQALLSRGDYIGATAKANEAERLNAVYMPGEDTHIQLYIDIDRARRTGRVPAAAPKVAADPKVLLANARAAFQRGELDTAEDLAHQAEKASAGGVMPWLHAPWADTPAKVLRDVQTARAKQAPPPPAASGSTFMGVKNFFSRGNSSGGETKAPDDKTMPAASGPALGEGPNLNGPPRTGPTFMAAPAPAYAAAADSKARPMDPVKEDRSITAARQLVRDGYQALYKNDLERARKCAEEAKNLHAGLNWWEDNPDKLLADIHRKTPTTVAAAKEKKLPASPAAAPAKADGHALVREGRTLLRDGKLEEADQVCARAAATKTSWGLFEDSPDKLHHDIQSARGKHDREESIKLLAEARKLYAQGKLQDAKTRAWRAQQLHGPYSIWDLGDRPQKLLAEIEKTETDLRAAGKLPPPSVADQHLTQSVGQVSSRSGAPGGLPAAAPVADMVAKQRALALLSEARTLQAHGQLIEARQKALAAQRAAGEAARPAFLFGPEEDRPETALLQLSSLCDAKINNLLQHASDCVTANGSDPTRFQRAQADLAQARQLAQVFGQDTNRIDHKATWLRETQAAGMLAQGPRPLAPDLLPRPGPDVAQVANQDPPSKGKDLLDRARLELRSGQTAMARQLAEAAFAPALGVQEEAANLIRSIDAEEYNQARLAANRGADAGIEAFHQGDYRQAASIFRAINEDYLDPEKSIRLKEIASLPEMRPGGAPSTQTAASGPVKLSGRDFNPPSMDGPGTAHAGDAAGSREVAAGDSFEKLRALEEIQFQQLREDGLRAQREANERARAGDLAAAMDILRDFSARLKDTPLDSEKVVVLNRQIEGRLQQFRTLKAQRDFEKEQSGGFANASSAEHTREMEKHKRDAEVAALLKEFGTLYHDGKYAQAQMKAEQAHELDRDNVAADAAVNMIQIVINRDRAEEINRAKKKMFMTGLDDHPGPALDMKSPLAFAEDKEYMERVEKRRAFPNGIRTPTHNPIEQSIERKLTAPISPINFKDVPLKQAIEDLSVISGVNIVMDTAAMNEAGVNLEFPLSLKVENISLKSALNLLLSQVKLTYLIQDEVLQVTTQDKSKGNNKQIIYPVADLVIPPTDGTLPNTSNFDYALQRQANVQGVVNQGPSPFLNQTSLAGGTPVGSPNSSFASTGYHGGGQTSPQAATLRPGQTIEELLINVIQSMIAPDSWSDVGGKGTIKYFPIGLALVVNQTQDIQEQVADLLAALRRLQELEVAIEMRMITVSESFYEMIGVNFDINIQNNNARFGPQLVSQNFQQAGQINNFSPNGFVAGLTPAGTFTPDLSIPITNSSFQFAQPPFGGFPGTLGMDGGLSLGLAFLSEIQVYMFLEAAQVDRRTNVMQAPKITVFNGQTANITVQDQQFFLTGVQLIQAGAQVFFVPTQQPFPLGVQLQVTPVVSADRRFVRVNLQPTLTNLASTNVPLIPVEIPVPQLFDGPGTGTTSGGQPVIFQMFFQQPTFTQISLNTTVSVPDGGTVLLGGLKTLSEGRTEAGPPILSKIPYINRLFMNTAYGRDSQSLLIMVTPRIIINEEEEQIFLGNIPPIPREQGP